MDPMSMGNDGSNSSNSMGSVSMVFTTDHSTPLFSAQWTPSSPGGYAGTCIFLVALAVISRLLLAWRAALERRWHDSAVRRRYVRVAGNANSGAAGDEKLLDPLAAAAAAADVEPSEEATLTSRGVDERVRVVRSVRRALEGVPWRLSTDLPRACVFTLQAGVGYLLMLAVMTLNVGYFLSVLAGLFVGELAVGRYAVQDDGHH